MTHEPPSTTSPTDPTRHDRSCECRACLDRELEMAARERRRDRWYFDLRTRPQPIFMIG